LRGLVHIIDDDASFRTAMERRLKHANYEVATYVSAQDLLDRFPGENVASCILLDVQIPGLDGPALQTRLNELGSTLPIIFLTGHPDIPTTVRAIKAGADDFLTKPVTSADLLRAIERAFARRQTTRDLQNKLDIVRDRVGTLTPREREVFELIVRPYQQACRQVVEMRRAHDQGSPPQGDGENASPITGGTCLPCRAGRRCVVHWTDGLALLNSFRIAMASGTIVFRARGV
jgi:FixJ family two-component response regulator